MCIKQYLTVPSYCTSGAEDAPELGDRESGDFGLDPGAAAGGGDLPAPLLPRMAQHDRGPPTGLRTQQLPAPPPSGCRQVC